MLLDLSATIVSSSGLVGHHCRLIIGFHQHRLFIASDVLVVDKQKRDNPCERLCCFKAFQFMCYVMADDISAIFLPQWLTLQCAGFLPLTFGDQFCRFAGKHWRYQQMISTAFKLVGLFWLFCQIITVYIQVQLFLTGSGVIDKNDNWILKALEIMPYTFIAARPLGVLIIMYTTHKASERLQVISAHFFAVCFPDIRRRRHVVVKWQKVAWTAFFVTFLIHFGFDFYASYDYFRAMGSDFDADLGLKYPRMNMRWLFITWTLGEGIPFFLSQQVYFWAVLSASLLATAIKTLHHQMKEQLNAVTQDTFTYTSMHALNEKVLAWQKLYMEMLKFCHSLQHFFSWILFIIYCCDSASLLGYIAAIINNFQKDGWIETRLSLYAFSALVFAVYGTIFAIPFFVVSERSSALLFTVHELSVVTKHIQKQKGVVQSAELAGSLNELMANLRDNQCHFSGGGLFHYTRGFLVGTFTLAISISVLVKELVAKEQLHTLQTAHLSTSLAASGILQHNYTGEHSNNSIAESILSELQNM
ncbi:hypothetical protein RvY_10912-2 [Ramazzottius varieornatus]|uniref:Gustatory receptor n=1 Tax=Ramazzottius varieornatus TaxID=947166 RepID=A0A1D1VGS0_RAMVA|nr:hypothetical protein RvY_10912-2 [Ramazzottius varieornatus]